MNYYYAKISLLILSLYSFTAVDAMGSRVRSAATIARSNIVRACTRPIELPSAAAMRARLATQAVRLPGAQTAQQAKEKVSENLSFIDRKKGSFNFSFFKYA